MNTLNLYRFYLQTVSNEMELINLITIQIASISGNVSDASGVLLTNRNHAFDNKPLAETHT